MAWQRDKKCDERTDLGVDVASTVELPCAIVVARKHKDAVPEPAFVGPHQACVEQPSLLVLAILDEDAIANQHFVPVSYRIGSDRIASWSKQKKLWQ